MASILSAAGSIEPEVLRARLASLGDPALRERVSTVVDAVYACMKEFQQVDFSELERQASIKSARDLWVAVEAPVAAMWMALEDLQQSMSPLTDEHERRMHTARKSAAGDSGAAAGAVDLADDAAEDADLVLIGVADGDASQSTSAATSAPGAPDAARAAAAATPASNAVVATGAGAGAVAPARAAPTPGERIAETAWAMSFVMSGEVDGFRRRIPALMKMNDPWELIGAVQDHVGHMYSAVKAIAVGIYSSLPGHMIDMAGRETQDPDLFMSRELRTRVFQLRDEVLAIEAAMAATPAGAWQELLERMQRAVQSFMFSAAFGWMRASDKRAFLEHQRSVAELLALWSPLRAAPAKRGVAAMARYLEALELINNRECLKNHDRRALRIAVTNLSAARDNAGDNEGRAAMGRALAALADVQGRDQELDKLVAQTLDPRANVPVAAILVRAGEVLAKLGG